MARLTALERALGRVDLRALASARWFAGKGREPAALALVDALEVPEADGGMLCVADVLYADGAPERYLLPGRIGPGGAFDEAPPGDPLWPALVRTAASGGTHTGATGTFTATPGTLGIAPATPARPLSDDQSNTSVVLGERFVVKCYRRLVAGTHPEPELLAGLDRVGSRRAPAFGGALVRASSEGSETLACLYEYAPGEPVGWEGLIARLRDALAADDGGALEALVAEAGALGSVAGELHVDLAAAFGTAAADDADAQHALTAARARLDEALAVATPDVAAVLGPHARTAAAVLDDLGLLTGAPVTRCHGDLHVAQFVASPERTVVVDFEGEPGLPLERRRRPGSPLRDLACLLLSLDHVAAAASRRLGFGGTVEPAFAWSARARERAEGAYGRAVAGSPLTLDRRLLRAFEVEKECHEVVYAARVLPAWSYAPRLTLPRLLGEAP